jgi:hypothetical protein
MSMIAEVTIGSILEALKTEKAEYVARQIDGLSEKKLRNALKSAGYEYSNKAPKGWRYIGKGIQPLKENIFDYVNSSSPKMKRSSQTVHSEFTSSNIVFTPNNTVFTPSNADFTGSNIEVITDSPIVHQQFTNDEVSMIKEMLYEWKKAVNNATVDRIEETETEQALSLHDRIKQLQQSDKTQKTIIIDKEIGERLDRFCQTEKVNKSDVLHLALMDFLEKM